MIDRDAELPLKRQAQLLGISRGTAYYNPKPIAEAKLALMRSIHELHLAHQIHLSQTAVCSNERSRLCTRVRHVPIVVWQAWQE